MIVKIYEKLVRDRIPEIILKSGHKPFVRTLEHSEYYKELKKKLIEEVAEFIESDDISEVADILEVLEAINKHRGFSADEVRDIRMRKAERNGQFKDRIFLEKVEEKEA